jgi:hypothetical protein
MLKSNPHDRPHNYDTTVCVAELNQNYTKLNPKLNDVPLICQRHDQGEVEEYELKCELPAADFGLYSIIEEKVKYKLGLYSCEFSILSPKKLPSRNAL